MKTYLKSSTIFLLVFSFFEKTTNSCRVRRLSVRPSVRMSFVEMISFRGKSKSNEPIDLKLGLNVGRKTIHV